MDIDGLRAFAVGSVVIYHAFPELLTGGFVGVDVFFVISGFLITSIIAQNLAGESFSFGDFYARRVLRIFPALIVVLAGSYLFGWILLLPQEYMQLGKHMAGGAVFSSNILLIRESGYFDVSSELKPLLHLWSLGIEEQFYIAWPLFAYAAYKCRLKLGWVALSFALCSFLASIYLLNRNMVATFYFPGTRAWELMIGCILACVVRARSGVSPWPAHLTSLVGLGLIIFSFFSFTKADPFPGWRALLPTTGTALLIWSGPQAVVNKNLLAVAQLVWLGRISFPLYLWHWPLLVFARVAASGEPAISTRIAVVVVSVLLAWCTYVFIERPVRYHKGKALTVVSLCVLMTLCGLLGLNAYHKQGLEFRTIAQLNRDITQERRWDFWTDEDCVKTYGTEPCKISGGKPRVMLLGDSHANHLFPGIVREFPELSIINVGTCWALDGVIMQVHKNQATWPCTNRDTFTFARKVLEANPSVREVIISGWWGPVLAGGLPNSRFEERWGGYSLLPQRPEERGLALDELAFRGFSRTISYLEMKGLKVVLVLETPYMEKDLGEFCSLGRRFSSYSNCSIPRSDVDARRVKSMAMVQRLKEVHPGLVVYDPLPQLCDENRCYFLRDHKLLYRDENHLSLAGSYALGEGLAPVLRGLISARSDKITASGDVN